MKSLANYATEAFSTKNMLSSNQNFYHFSYDIIEYKDDFNNYENALKKLLTILKEAGVLNITEYCKSTLLLESRSEITELDSYIRKHLKDVEYLMTRLCDKNVFSNVPHDKKYVQKLWDEL